MDVVDIVPGEVPPVGGLPDSMQVGVDSGEVPPGDHVSVQSKLGRVTVKYPQLMAYQSVDRQNVCPRCEARWTRVHRSTKGKWEAPSPATFVSLQCHIHQ